MCEEFSLRVKPVENKSIICIFYVSWLPPGNIWWNFNCDRISKKEKTRNSPTIFEVHDKDNALQLDVVVCCLLQCFAKKINQIGNTNLDMEFCLARLSISAWFFLCALSLFYTTFYSVIWSNKSQQRKSSVDFLWRCDSVEIEPCSNPYNTQMFTRYQRLGRSCGTMIRILKTTWHWYQR